MRVRILTTALPLLAATMLLAHPAAATEPVSDASVYPLDTCAVSSTALGDDPVRTDHAGRSVLFCSEDCRERFERDPEAHLEDLDARIRADQEPLYPVETCVVSGQPLGGMGEPFSFLHGNRLVKLCCKGCLGAFEDDPGAHVAVLDAAVVENQAAEYPLDTCAVTGMRLGGMGDADDYVVAGRLVRLCCAGCRPAVADAPVVVLRAVAEARATPASEESADR